MTIDVRVRKGGPAEGGIKEGSTEGITKRITEGTTKGRITEGLTEEGFTEGCFTGRIIDRTTEGFKAQRRYSGTYGGKGKEGKGKDSRGEFI